MTLRGLISPPRSRSSPRESRSHSSNANATANNPPSRPNYMSPRRRPTTVVNPKEQRSQRKETQTTTNLKASATRAIKNKDSKYASQSPPKNRSSTSRLDASKPTTKIVSSSPRRQTAAPNPNDLQTHKKLDNNNNNNSSTKTSATRPSSPRTVKPITQPRGPTLSKTTVKAGAARSDVGGAKAYFDSRNDSSNHLPSRGSGHPQDVNIGNVGNQNPFSGGPYATLSDPHLQSRLQHLSIDGTDLSNIVLHANSIYESIGSDTKEECSSSQTSNNGPRIFQIYKDIASHRQGNSSITSYFTKLKAMWDELGITYSDHVAPQCCSCEHGEREKVMQFLVGLNDSYSTICAQILDVKPFPTVEKAYTVIIREEKRRELVLSLETVAAKVMQNKWLLQNDVSSNNIGDERIEVDNYNDEEQQIDQNDQYEATIPVSIYNSDVQIPSFPNEPLLIDLGSPVRC